ncbi:Cytochrome c6 [Paraburkholderia domus]|jgi:mono/diheme cytochrome c family protein|uniref:Cytochrome c6 n=1 Tax=Paraburkholderia domus TaxID=2793075 RepID=A0A9N8N2T4_9BURK|nr:cytochrome c [Paraburkholderia domus]MBK5049329.1 cytochrome c [Burkholderia sp. R-70006]MBK5062107.1 cytochrome c [Burkholderia sp. R-70199]MBK5087361.1 cytochrome c [Burkholderia sp. R-69927]MBK5124286.1 cytochrome c [Burkholderia sp. R-69980]MBK5166948.1 cytochrome c [Burkholderia sp. R-70211]MBK5180705.1 cytochrome c [Burkholderia sp. R-69749]MCI0147779.1 c-type cytochrome [Paraburkholderia sediminicola]
MARPTLIFSVMLTAWLSGAATVSALAVAQDAPRTFTISPDYRFTEKSGEALYNATCAGCHMPDGKGAQGAGHYPALADNPAVEAAPYVIVNVLHGRKAMPSFGDAMDDDQVAAVVNYTRTHFGNRFAGSVTPSQVRSLR